MAEIFVDHATLTKGTQDMNASITNVRATLNKLDSEVQNSRSYWAGQAAGAMGTVMMEYKNKSEKLQMALDNLSQLVGKTNQNHQANEEASMRSINAYQSVLTA